MAINLKSPTLYVLQIRSTRFHSFIQLQQLHSPLEDGVSLQSILRFPFDDHVTCRISAVQMPRDSAALWVTPTVLVGYYSPSAGTGSPSGGHGKDVA